MALLTYIPSFLGNIYSYLGWDSTKVQLIIDEVLEALDISDESQVSQKILHSVAKTKSLEFALNDLSVGYHVSADGSSYDPQQVFTQVSEMLAVAQSESEQYLAQTTIGEVIYSENPYDVSTYYQVI